MPAVAAQLEVQVGANVASAVSGLEKVNKSITGTASFFGRAASTALGFVGATLGLNAVANVAGFANDAIFGLNNTIDEQTTAFTNLLGSGEKATAFLAQLQDFANRTPFDTSGIGKIAQGLLAVGVPAEQVLPLLTNIGGAVAAMGGGTAEVTQLARAFGQIQSKGRLQGDEILQLAEGGIPALQILADSLGLSTERTQQLVSAGKIAAPVFFKAFNAWAQARNLPKILEESQNTWRGAMSTIADVLSQGAAKAFRPLFDLVKEGAVNLAKLLQSKDFDAFVGRVRAGVAAVVQPLGTFAVMIGNIAQTHGLTLLQAALVATEIVIGQVFGPNSATAFHGFFDTLQAAGAFLVANAPTWFAWLRDQAPGAVEFALGKLGELKDFLAANLPTAAGQVVAGFETIKGWITTNLAESQHSCHEGQSSGIAWALGHHPPTGGLGW
jgi:tape measure domain-containing protein